MNKILVIGANGFIGHSIVKYSKEKKIQTIGITRDELNKFILPDICYKFNLPSTRLNKILKEHKPDLIINATGKSSIDFSIQKPEVDFQENISVTFSILNSIRVASPKSKFIYLSSAAVYGNPSQLPIDENCSINPISPYGYHKLLGEILCKEFSMLYNLHTACLRIFSVYGEGQRKQVIYDIFNKLYNEEIVQLKGDGSESRDFINVYDLIRAIFVIAEKGDSLGSIYNVGSGEEVRIDSLVNYIFNIVKINKKIIFTKEKHEGNPKNWSANISKLINLGYKNSISINEGLYYYNKWFLNNQKEKEIESANTII